MSPRAAWRLEDLGYGPVYDYAAGKVDWMAAGLATTRADTFERRALDGADREPPTCRPDELVSELPEIPAGRALVVVGEGRIVVGRYRPGGNAADGAVPVEAVMQPGPATVRAHEPLVPLLERMARRGAGEMIVSTPEGELLGVVYAGEESP